jgi:hypothetical protein
MSSTWSGKRRVDSARNTAGPAPSSPMYSLPMVMIARGFFSECSFIEIPDYLLWGGNKEISKKDERKI